MEPAQTFALSSRFSGSYSDGYRVIHLLPNGLLVVTLAPEVAKSTTQIVVDLHIGNGVNVGDTLCNIDGKPMESPVRGSIVDCNDVAGDLLARFAAGPTCSFIVILRPPAKSKFEIPSEFAPLC